MGGIPPPSALWAMCITPRLMELWAILFAGCGKAVFCFSISCEWCVHSGMGSYAHFHDAFFAFKALFRQRITGKGYYPDLAVPVRFLAALCALNTGSGSPVSCSAISKKDIPLRN